MIKEMNIFKRDDLFENARPSEVFAETKDLECRDYSSLAKQEFQKIEFYLNWKAEDFADVICKVEKNGEGYFFLFSLNTEKDSDNVEKSLTDLVEGLQNNCCPFIMHKIVGGKVLPLKEFYQHPHVF